MNHSFISSGVVYASPDFPCRCEVLADELYKGDIVVRCIDENSGADARVSLSVYDAKCIADDILSGDFDMMASFAFESRHDYGTDDFIEIFNHSGGGSEFDDYGREDIVSRQLHLSAACTGTWKLEVLVGPGIAEKNGMVYLGGMPTTYVSALLTRKDLRSFAHALDIAVSAWGNSKFGSFGAQEPA